VKKLALFASWRFVVLRRLRYHDGWKTLASMLRIAPAIVFLAGCAVACGGADEREGSSLPVFGNPAGPAAAPGMAGPSGNAPLAPGAGGTSPGGGAAPGASGSEQPSPALPLGGPSTTEAGSPGASVPIASPLPRSTPEAEGVSSSGVLALVEALADGSAGEIHSLMLLRHGKVVAEGWWAPYAPEDVHVLYSVTKSFNSTAVGFAVQEGLLDIDDSLLGHFSDLAPASPDAEMAAMRIRDLLTMSTGHETDPLDALRQRADGQWTRGFLETDVQRPPGSYFLYNSAAAYVLGSLVQRVTGQSVEEYLTPRLFEPLGITRRVWGKSAEGVNLADGGLSVRTEDLAKFGQLYLQGGVWNGEQVVPAQWVTDATQLEISTGNDDNNWGYGYGYQFWRSREGYRADGSLGQFSFVLPDQDIVLAITSGTNDTGGVMDRVWQYLLPAVASAAQPEDAEALTALRTRLASLALPTPSGAMSSPLAAGVSGRRYATGQNSQNITGVTLDFSGPTPLLSIEDADGTHSISVGLGTWQRQRTDYRKHINELFDTPEQGLAAQGAWSADDTFVARLCFDETPYTMTATFAFEGEQLRMNASYNVRWGAASEPEVIGTR
jgi:CubicO group peptidase (beta-lactamase class C family)